MKFDSDYRVNAYANYFFSEYNLDMGLYTAILPNCRDAYDVDSVPENYDIAFTLTQPRDNQVILAIQLENYRSAADEPFIIPFLHENEFSLTFTPGDLFLVQDLIRALVGLTVYAGGDCSYAQINLGVPLDEDFIHEPALIDITSKLVFYESTCRIVTHQYAKAIERLEAYLPYFSGETAPTVNLAWAYFQDEQEERAFNLLDDTIVSADDADKSLLFTKRSQLYALDFRYDEAIADMDAAIALDPDDPALYVERGQQIMSLHQWDRALADYNHALELDPDYADAYYYRGILDNSVPAGIDARRDALADFLHYLDLAPAGDHAKDAARYANDIQAQFDALTATPST